MAFKMNIKALSIFVVLLGKFSTVSGEGQCGNLTIKSRYLVPGMTVEMQFIPKYGMKPIIEQGSYRWVFENNPRYFELFKKESASKYDPRLSEVNYTLSIQNVQSHDEGRYMVECFDGNTYLTSNSVDLKLQESFPSTTRPTVTTTKTEIENTTTHIETSSTLKPPSYGSVISTVDNQTTDDEDNSSTLIAGVVSGMVLLVVVVVILVLILRKKRTFTKVSEFNNNNDETAGIIDDSAANDYATLNDCELTQDGHTNNGTNTLIDIDPYNSIDHPLVRSDTSAFEQQAHPGVSQPVDEYSKVIPRSLRKKDPAKTKSYENINETSQDEYATITISNNDNLCAGKTDSGSKEVYATVIPRSERLKSENASKPNKTNEMKKDFANIASQLAKLERNENWHSTPDLLKTGGNQYSNILLSSSGGFKRKSTKHGPRDQRLLDIHGLDSVNTDIEGHEYAAPSPIVRRKTGKKELQYIQIDHSDTSSHRSQSTESVLSLRPVEYSDIDFTKKAFVAPKRFPPPPSPRIANHTS